MGSKRQSHSNAVVTSTLIDNGNLKTERPLVNNVHRTVHKSKNRLLGVAALYVYILCETLVILRKQTVNNG